jgi:hypothetical protein
MQSIAYKVGDLAKQTGVSVRTLHYYDEIGLLSPSHRTESGYRVYGEDLHCSPMIRNRVLPLSRHKKISMTDFGACVSVLYPARCGFSVFR